MNKKLKGRPLFIGEIWGVGGWGGFRCIFLENKGGSWIEFRSLSWGLSIIERT